MNLAQELNDICEVIEEHAAKVAGITMVMSDYWLVGISDWVQDDQQEEQVLDWAAKHYKLPDSSYMGCFLHERLMLVALFVHLNRKDK